MRVRVAVVVIGCLAAAGAGGCGRSETCNIRDYSGGGTSGYQTARQALDSVLAEHEQWLSAAGWVLKGESAHGATFASGNDTVDVVKTPAGKWIVGGVTACQ